MTITKRALTALLLLLILAACFVTGITGPTSVTVGQSVTYDIAFETDSAGTNGTAYVFFDVPTGWTLTGATYDATVNGAATSGNATTGVSQSGTPCVAAPGPAAGYQRLGFSATFPTVTAADSGVLHVTLTVGGAAGNYTLSAFGGGSFGGPTQQCNTNQTRTLGVTVNAPPPLAAPTVAKAFSPATIAANGTSRLTVTLSNANAQAITGVAFTDTYPAGLANATPANLATTCGGTASSTANTLSLSGGTIPANGSCTVAIDVTAAAAGSYVNDIPAGAVTSTNAGSNTAGSGAATLTVTGAPPPPNPPVVQKSFAPSTIVPGAASRLTITLSNSNAVATTGVAFTDTYPAGLVNATPANLATTCGGTASSTANSVSLSGGTIPANGSCTVAIDVTAAAAGSYVNDIPAGAVTSTNAGSNTAATTATLAVAPAPAPAAAIPTASEWALLLMAAMLAAFAVKMLR